MVLNLLTGALLTGSIYGLLALGYSLIYKASRQMSFVQGELLMLGAFLGLTFYRYAELPFALALILTLGVMFVFGLVIERFVVRPLLKKKSSVIYIVLATIGLAIILQNIAMLIWGGRVLRFPPIFKLAEDIKLFGIVVPPESILGFILSFIFMYILHIFMKKTKYGTSMRAAAQDSIAASVVGINVPRTMGITWAIAASLAGLGGVLYGPVFGVSISMGSLLGVKGFAAAVIGGYGNMYGAIIGGLFLGILETFTAAYISSTYKDFIAFGILIIFLIIKPSGLFNEKVLE